MQNTELFGRYAPLSEGTNWFVAAIMVAFHIGAIAAFFFFSWKALAVAALLWWMAGSLGIGMGYHRLLTHRGYKVPKWVEYFLTFCATLALEGGPIYWVAVHRVHHQRSDRPGDPHSPREGSFWAHMGWILSGKSLHQNTEVLAKYAPDLCKDRFHVMITKYHWVPQVVVGLILLAVGGFPMVLWGVFFRVTYGLHCTWLVNSATHMWGSRRFKTRDDSTNLWWVALLSFGEGWHNNHHAHPTSARHGLAWYELDMNWIGITFLRWFGLAKDIRVARVNQPIPGVAISNADEEMAPELAGSAAYD